MSEIPTYPDEFPTDAERLALAVEEIIWHKRENARLAKELKSALDAHSRLNASYKTATARLENALAQAREFDELSRFWKSAAERALRLWERAQDDLDDTKTLARRAARMAEAYIESYIDEISDDEEEVLDDLGQCRIWLKQLEDECAPSS